MEYLCNICNYKTNDRSNYHKHLKSQKHIKTSEKSTNTFGDSIRCEICNIVFTRRSSLIRHISKCRDNVLLTELKNLKKENEQFKVMTDHLKEKEEIYRSENDLLRKLLVQSDRSDNSLPTLLYKHCDNAPPIYTIPASKVEELEISKDRLVKEFISAERHKILHEKLGKFIVMHYKKDNIEDQSIFNTDTARLSYMIRELIFDDITRWVPDKNGLKATKYMITPLLDHVKDLLLEHQKIYFNKIPHNTSMGQMENMIGDNRTLIKIVTEIDDRSLEKRILRFVSPYLKFEKDAIKALGNNKLKALPGEVLTETKKTRKLKRNS